LGSAFRRKPLWSPEIDEKFGAYANLIRRAITADLKRYRRFGRMHMLWFRFGGLLEIGLSVSFPLVISYVDSINADSNPPQVNSNLVFSAISVTIALIAAVRSFYGWHENWNLYATQRLTVRILLRDWEMALLPLVADPSSNQDRAHAATITTVSEINRVLEHEQDSFFGSMKLPEEILKGREDKRTAAATDGQTPSSGGPGPSSEREQST
jgi:hypothetical protein